jgi:hypothetical protein
MRRRLLVLPLLAAAAASCGSSSVSPAAYRAHVRKVCEHYGREAKAIPEPAPGASSVAANERRSMRLFRHLLDDLASIKPPTSERRLARRWIAAGRTLARFTDHEIAVLDRDQRLFEREIKHLDIPKHNLTPEEIAHPTGAILDEVYRYSPAFRRFMRDSNRFAMRAKPVEQRFLRLGKRLGVTACVG